MRYKQIPVLIILLFTGISNLFSQQVTYDWQHVIPGNTYTALCCMANDSSGNIYVGGRLDSTITFVDTTVTNTINTGFLAKFDSDGNRIWFKQFEYSGTVYSICFDSEDKLYISGMYFGKVRIDDTLLYTHDIDTTFTGMFLAKFDTDGNRIWAKTTAGLFYYESDYAKLKQMTIDRDDNIVLVGTCINEIEYFDTTIIYTKILDSMWVTTPYPHWTYGYYSTNYIAKYNKHGQKLWIKDAGMYQQHYLAIATDYSNNILLTGYFWDDYPFVVDSVTLIASGGENLFIIKYNTFGHLMWAQRGGGSINSGNRGFDIISDSLDNIYLTGQISGGGVEFGGNIYFYNGTYKKAFLVKYDSLGIVKWVNRLQGTHPYYGESSVFSLFINNTSLYLCGYFNDSLILGFTNLISIIQPSGMFLRYNFDGVLLDAAMDMVISNNVYPIEFSLSDGNYFVAGNKAYFTNYWNWDLFFGKLQEPFLTYVELVANNNKIDCMLYPNPCQDILKIDFYDFSNRVISIYDISGNLISSYTQNKDQLIINVNDFLPGIYLLQIQSTDSVFTRKFIKI